MATIREKKPGVWEVRVFTGRDARGKPTQISRTVRGGKRDAQRTAVQLECGPGRAVGLGQHERRVVGASADDPDEEAHVDVGRRRTRCDGRGDGVRPAAGLALRLAAITGARRGSWQRCRGTTFPGRAHDRLGDRGRRAR